MKTLEISRDLFQEIYHFLGTIIIKSLSCWEKCCYNMINSFLTTAFSNVAPLAATLTELNVPLPISSLFDRSDQASRLYNTLTIL